jgi:signal transduction histidine kinase
VTGADPLAGTRRALGQALADRDDTITYLSTIRVVMEVLERARGLDQVCQEIAEILVEQIGAETCALAIRDRPGEPFRLRGFATQSQRIGEAASGPPENEATWLTAATLMASGGRPACYRRDADGGLAAVAEVDGGEGILGLPCDIGGEPNGVVILEYVTAPGQQFARLPALGLVGDIIGGALTIARTRDSVARVLAELEREVGATRDALSQREDTLREREDNVEALTQALVESNQVKREFLGTLSHELRTPLNAILGYSELLHDGMVGPLAGEQLTLLERMMVSARHLNQLIDDMLFFVQIEATQTRVERETFSLGGLVNEIVEALPDRQRSKAAFRVEIAAAAERVSCDRALLKRTVFHLLANGFKFTQTGEVCFTAEGWQAGDGVAIAVRDTGIGIAAERLEEIFQAFRQLDMSNTRRFSGLGLGLALVQRCVRILGGQVSVRSAVGEGSEFRVELPATLSGEAAPPPRR